MKSSKLLVAALAATALLGLTACGSSGGSGSAAPPATPTTSAASQNIVALAAATPDLSTLVTAVQAAGLATTLQGAGPFTVFAPNNAAFAKVPAAVTKNLLLPCNKAALASVLSYHVVPSKVTSAEIMPGDVTTVQGSTLKLAVDGSTVKVNDATVVTPDVAASNGVVHIIDTVLIPPNVDVTALKSTC